jgi:hypothetical protein
MPAETHSHSEQLAECRTAIELVEAAARFLADDRRAPADETLEE